MSYRNYIILLCLIFKIDAKIFETKESCVNNSDVLWNSLNFLNHANLFQKWKIETNEDISDLCSEDLKILIDNLNNGTLWAIKMLDASGHYEGKFFNGHEYWLGSNTQCQDLNELYNKFPSSNRSVSEQHIYRRTFENRMVMVNDDDVEVFSAPPFSVKFAVATVIFKPNYLCQLEKETASILYIGICFPNSCNKFDAKGAVESITNKDFMEIKNIRIIPGEYMIWNDKRFYFLSSIFFIITLLITLATCLEYLDSKYCRKFRVTLCYRILNAFSVISNLRIIGSLEVGEDTLAPIHGLKFISMIWVVLVHTCLILFQVSGNKKFRNKSESELLYQTISNGTYSVDTFFTLSGVLVSFLFFRTVAKHSVKQLIGQDGFFGHILLYISMMLYRLARLSTPYLLAIVLTGFLTEQKVHYAPLFLPNGDHINCVQHWWRNALYINTFYPSGEMCMTWSWYLSNDTQFYVVGVSLLLLALRWRIFSLILGLICVVLSNTITAIISYQMQYVVDIKDPFAHYDELYDKPWIRLGPYFIGMATGWFLFNINCTLKIQKNLSTIFWACSLASMLFIIYGPVYFANQPIFSAIYTALSHSVWSFAISWIVVACATGNGFWINSILSWKYMYPFSRLSYCAYLIHPLLIRMILLSSDTSFYISIEIMTVLFFGFVVLSLVVATLLSLAFESPVVALLRLGYPMKRNKE